MGIDPSDPVADVPADTGSAPAEVRLRDLRPTDVPVIVIGRVVSAERREITRRSDGGRRPVLSGLLSDGTATVRFTWWDPPAEEIERGTVLRAGPVQVREYRGKAEVSFNWRTRVAPASERELPDLGPDDLERRTVASLAEGDEGFQMEARVASVTARTVTVGEERRQLYEGVLFDATGAVGYTAWSDFALREGAPLRVIGGYVRSFRGRLRLTLDERSHVERLGSDTLPSMTEW
jgi:ssDNA-binding replication factor A large subunit